MRLENAELLLNKSSKLLISRGDSVESCKIRVYDCKVGSEHPIEIKAYGILRNCVIFTQLPETILIHKDGLCMENAIFPMEVETSKQ